MTGIWDDIEVIQSTDENVAKYVFRREDAVAESVLYKVIHTPQAVALSGR